MTQSEKAVIAYAITIYIAILISMIIRVYIVKNKKEYKGKSFLKKLVYDYYPSYNLISIPFGVFIIINVAILLVYTTIFIYSFL